MDRVEVQPVPSTVVLELISHSPRRTVPSPAATDFVDNKASGFAATAALEQAPANKAAHRLQAWMEKFTAGAPAYRSGIRPVWTDVLPSVLNAMYRGTSVAVLPNGVATDGDVMLDVNFIAQNIFGSMNFNSLDPDLSGDISFDGLLQIGGANHTMAGTVSHSGAFGGDISLGGAWSAGFYGSLAEMAVGDWQATVVGGPHAGVVTGKFEGQR